MLHRLRSWFGQAYPDARLAWLARHSVADDHLLADVTCVRITSTYSVLRLKGRVPQAIDKARIEADIRTALATARLPYAGICNTLQANASGAPLALVDQPKALMPLFGAP